MSDDKLITRSLTREQWDRLLIELVDQMGVVRHLRCRWHECMYWHADRYPDDAFEEAHTGDCPLAEEEDTDDEAMAAAAKLLQEEEE